MLVQSFSGIRGVYGKDLTEDIARRYAYVFNEFLKKKISNNQLFKKELFGNKPIKKKSVKEPLIVVGYDTRESSESLKGAVFDSLFNIIDVGVMPVAAVELAVREFEADGGIMITASHNEPEFNGFKFLDSDGAILRSKDSSQIIAGFKKISKLSEEDFLDNHSYKEELKVKVKRLRNRRDELISRYCVFLRDIVGEVDNNVKVLLDVNGGSGVVLNEIIAHLDIKNIKVVNDVLGEFKRKIEPNGESLGYLIDLINKNNAEFAAGFDCDADRVQILLKDGSLVDGNYLLALVVDNVLGNKKGVVVINDATSNVVKKVAEGYGCTVKEVEVGEINVVDEMLNLDSPVGGEGSSGGVIVSPSRCRDGILTLMYVLKIMNEGGKTLTELIKELPLYFNVQKKFKLDKKFDRNKVKSYYLAKGFKIQETGDSTGGLKIIIDENSFVWFRISKTEANLLRVIVDSDSESNCSRLLEEASSVI